MLFRSPAVGTTGVQLPAAWEFIAIVGPLLGIAFAFDAVNGERLTCRIRARIAREVGVLEAFSMISSLREN